MAGKEACTRLLVTKIFWFQRLGLNAVVETETAGSRLPRALLLDHITACADLECWMCGLQRRAQ
jgi:hypothetical protein